MFSNNLCVSMVVAYFCFELCFFGSYANDIRVISTNVSYSFNVVILWVKKSECVQNDIQCVGISSLKGGTEGGKGQKR